MQVKSRQYIVIKESEDEKKIMTFFGTTCMSDAPTDLRRGKISWEYLQANIQTCLERWTLENRYCSVKIKIHSS